MTSFSLRKLLFNTQQNLCMARHVLLCWYGAWVLVMILAGHVEERNVIRAIRCKLCCFHLGGLTHSIIENVRLKVAVIWCCLSSFSWTKDLM